MIEDHTLGFATVHFWDNLLAQLENKDTFSFQNLSVKKYSGMTLLGTTPTTTFQKVNLQLTEVKGPQFLSTTEKEIVIREKYAACSGLTYSQMPFI